MHLSIKVGARSSLLSQAQVKEVLKALKKHHKGTTFDCIFLETTGDKDRTTSLRQLDKTDFFTKEIDELQLADRCRISIHSAKDLPAAIPTGLKLIAVTKGLDPSDSLVMRPGETILSLPPRAVIGTSSGRREEAVRQLRPDATFIDIRGTIGERLAKLKIGAADGVVIAEAALLRLRLQDLNRVRLPGDTVPGQGQLAILGREGDLEMETLFSCLDAR